MLLQLPLNLLRVLVIWKNTSFIPACLQGLSHFILPINSQVLSRSSSFWPVMDFTTFTWDPLYHLHPTCSGLQIASMQFTLDWNSAWKHDLHFTFVTAPLLNPVSHLLKCKLNYWAVPWACGTIWIMVLSMNYGNFIRNLTMKKLWNSNFQGENWIHDRWNFVPDLQGKNRSSKTSSLSPFLWPLATHT